VSIHADEKNAIIEKPTWFTLTVQVE